MELLEKIPFDKIDKIEIYENKRKKYMPQIKSETKADYIINGGIFSFQTFKPFGNVKVNGIVKSNPKYTEYGYMWDKGSDISYSVIPSTKMNYLGCVGCVLNGKKQTLKYNPDMGGCRQRSAIGISNGSFILYACNKSNSKTPETLQNYMISNRWNSGLMLDGGGSTQAIFPTGTIKSSENGGKGRIVQNYILVYLKKEATKKPSANSNKALQPNSSSCPYRQPYSNIKLGSKGEGAKWVQWHLSKLQNSSIVVDGVFGRKSVEALKLFQKKNHLVADGICGRSTKTAMVDSLKRM